METASEAFTSVRYIVLAYLVASNRTLLLCFSQRLVDTFNFHGYASLTPNGDKIDPRLKKGEHRELEVTSVMYAAQAGALSTLQRYKMNGMDLSVSNYDGRSPLHVAAAEGHYHVIEMLLECPKCSVNSTDR